MSLKMSLKMSPKVALKVILKVAHKVMHLIDGLKPPKFPRKGTDVAKEAKKFGGVRRLYYFCSQFTIHSH